MPSQHDQHWGGWFFGAAIEIDLELFHLQWRDELTGYYTKDNQFLQLVAKIKPYQPTSTNQFLPPFGSGLVQGTASATVPPEWNLCTWALAGCHQRPQVSSGFYAVHFGPAGSMYWFVHCLKSCGGLRGSHQIANLRFWMARDVRWGLFLSDTRRHSE